MGALKPAAALLAAAAFFASVALVLLATAVVTPLASGQPNATLARVDHVADGDTLTLRNGQRVRTGRPR